jgi:hypothetical protein
MDTEHQSHNLGQDAKEFSEIDTAVACNNARNKREIPEA